MADHLIVTVIGSPDHIEEALIAITGTGVSGSTVIPGMVYTPEGREIVKDEIGISQMPGEFIEHVTSEGRLILTVVQGDEFVRKVKDALQGVAKKLEDEGKRFSITALPISRVAGLQPGENEDTGRDEK